MRGSASRVAPKGRGWRWRGQTWGADLGQPDSDERVYAMAAMQRWMNAHLHDRTGTEDRRQARVEEDNHEADVAAAESAVSQYPDTSHVTRHTSYASHRLTCGGPIL
jgi:hypothetical protein